MNEVKDKLKLLFVHCENIYRADYNHIGNNKFYWHLGEDITGTMFDKLLVHNKTKIDEFRKKCSSV